MQTGRLVTFVLILALATACSSAGEASPSQSPLSPGASEPPPGAGYAALPTCLFEPCPEFDAGTYQTSSPDGFMPGLVLTLQDGFTSFEHSTGELELHRVDDPNGSRQLLIWYGLAAAESIVPPVQLVQGVGGSPEDLVAWLGSDPRFTAAEPVDTTLGGIPATEIEIQVSPEAENEEPLTADGGCDPAEIVCVGVFYDPVHWTVPGYAWAIMRKSIPDPSPGECCEMLVRLQFAQIGTGADASTLTVALSISDVDPAAQMDDWHAEVQPILDSLVMPSALVADEQP